MAMSELRGILIAFAVLLLAGIYWLGRRDGRRERAAAAAQLPGNTAAAGGTPRAAPVTCEAEIRAASSEAQHAKQYAASTQAAAVLPGPPARIEPTLGEAAPVAAEDAPPLDASEAGSMGEPVHDMDFAAAEAPAAMDVAAAPPSRMVIALLLVASVPRFSGAHLRAALEAESLVFGKYQIFHRLAPQGEIVFSIASMLEPGTFVAEEMFDEQYPGIALFMQIPGALDGVSALNELISCGRRLQEALGGVLQDELGAPLQAARIEQLRREVRDFEETVRQSRPRGESLQS